MLALYGGGCQGCTPVGFRALGFKVLEYYGFRAFRALGFLGF